MLSGSVSSSGAAYGRVLVIKEPGESTPSSSSPEANRTKELERFNTAVRESLEELERLREEVRLRIGEHEEKIFEAQAMFLEDPMLIEDVQERISRENLHAEKALHLTVENLEQEFREIDDPTLRQRIADIKDVEARLLRKLGGKGSFHLDSLVEPVILMAHELLPSQVAQLDRDKILAIVTEKGGINSHASIIARSLDIPAVVGARDLIRQAVHAETAIVDGLSGKIYLNPGGKHIEKYMELKARDEQRRLEEKINASGGTVKTLDGGEVFIYANVGRLEELNKLKIFGVEGIGVLRTEFLLMDHDYMPKHGEMVESLRKILEFMDPRPVNIRLFDLGGDKKFPFIDSPHEMNPSLGDRGIRFLLRDPGILRSQLQAILEAGNDGNVRIMLPMVTRPGEVEKLVEILREMELEMSSRGMNIKTQIPVGIMIETPASALLAEHFGPLVDFFSVGTNDLTQYVLAADRDSEYVQDIYNSLNPAVLLTLKSALEGARKNQREISICGEMASNTRAIPVLLGMGFNRLSVGINRIPEVKAVIRKIDLRKARRLARKCLKASRALDVEKMVGRFLRKMEKDAVKK